MPAPLHIALISGPAYDPLYDRLATFTASTGIAVSLGFTGDHPTLNRHLAACNAAPYDLISTHSKYAPSQRGFLAPLDSVLPPDALTGFEERTLALARIDGVLCGLPRLIDARLLHYRTDLVPTPPPTWDALLETARHITRTHGIYGFAFPGRESGLFGTFYELVEMAGGHLFPAGGVPEIEQGAGAWALGLLRVLYAEELVPPATPDWHFDEVHRAFRTGQVAMIGDWPGFYGLHADPDVSAVADRFAVCPYPAGPAGTSRAYAGAHTFALTPQGVAKPEAVALLRFLTAPEQQMLEARHGAVPPRRRVLQRVLAEAHGPERNRWHALKQVVSGQMLIPPKLERYPEVEAVIWRNVQAAFTGRLAIDRALAHITRGLAALYPLAT